MKPERYKQLMEDTSEFLTDEEIEEGWHFCHDWDDLLIGPGYEKELEACTCDIESCKPGG